MRITAIIVVGLALVLGSCGQNESQAAESQARELPATVQNNTGTAADIAVNRLAESQAATASPAIQAEAPLAALQPGLAETMDGQRVSTTQVVVLQVNIPELEGSMKDPFMSGRFQGENIVLDELLICDAGALVVEESCIALSALSAEKQEVAVNYLIEVFDDHKCRIWADFIAELARDNVLPENLAEYHIPCGITPPRDPLFSVKIAL